MVKPKVLDLFAGCGGLSYGFQMAGFDVVAANDLFDEAAETHRLNHPHARFFLGSITDREVQDAIAEHAKREGCDVIVGGPPCQAYSLAGKRDVDDERGHLFEEYVEMVRRLQPAVFVMENVKGLLSMAHDRVDLDAKGERALQKLKDAEARERELRLLRKRAKNTERFKFGRAEEAELKAASREVKRLREASAPLRERVVDKIVAAFGKLGYRVQYRLLNAADYGVPQRRERVVFIGTRLSVEIHFPAPTHTERLDGVLSLFEHGTQKWVTTGEAIGDLVDAPEDPAWGHEFTQHSKAFAERLEATPVGGSVYGGYSDAWFRQPPDEPSRTVKENHGGVFVHYAKPRVMTPRELARLQSFPDDFCFEGPKSKVLVQIGNAVPPLLGKAVGEAVMQMLQEGRAKERASATRPKGKKQRRA